LKIGDLAARTGVTVETLRYYESRNLLQPSQRLSSGYRVYDPDAVALIHFIKRAQSLGFTLGEVEELVRLREQAWSGDATYLLREAIVAKVQDVDRRMKELRALGDELKALIAACDEACLTVPASDRCDGLEDAARTAATADRDTGLDCPLVEALDAESDARDNRRGAGRSGSKSLAGAGTASVRT
jgi:DNA-binding transcriptional MerR regulator